MARCVDCGLLALRHNDSLELVETDLYYRETGTLSPIAQQKLQDIPICFARRYDLKTEYLAAKEAQGKTKGRPAVLNKDRECIAFMDWQQGFAPKEHLEMRIEQALRESQQREAERQRVWQAEQARLADERQTAQLKLTQDYQRDNLRAIADTIKWNFRGALINAAIVAVATVAAAVFIWATTTR